MEKHLGNTFKVPKRMAFGRHFEDCFGRVIAMLYYAGPYSASPQKNPVPTSKLALVPGICALFSLAVHSVLAVGAGSVPETGDHTHRHHFYDKQNNNYKCKCFVFIFQVYFGSISACAICA